MPRAAQKSSCKPCPPSPAKPASKRPAKKPAAKKPVKKAAPRPKLSLVEATMGITRNDLKRIMLMAKAISSKDDVYVTLRKKLVHILGSVLEDAVVYVKVAGRKTISLEDINQALAENGLFLAAGVVKMHGGPHISLEGVDSANKNLTRKRVEKKTDRRFKPGTVAKRESVRLQKHSRKFQIRLLPFARLIRSLLAELDPELRLSSPAREALQAYVEQRMITLCSDAYSYTRNATRVRLSNKDIEAAYSKMCNIKHY